MTRGRGRLTVLPKEDERGAQRVEVNVVGDLSGDGGVSRLQPTMGKQEKVAVCHRPPGNPSNSRINHVAPAAVAAHLAHGDHLVEPEACNDRDDDCDGGVDNNLDLGPCTVGTGVCQVTGEGVCEGGEMECEVQEMPGCAECVELCEESVEETVNDRCPNGGWEAFDRCDGVFECMVAVQNNGLCRNIIMGQIGVVVNCVNAQCLD